MGSAVDAVVLRAARKSAQAEDRLKATTTINLPSSYKLYHSKLEDVRTVVLVRIVLRLCMRLGMVQFCCLLLSGSAVTVTTRRLSKAECLKEMYTLYALHGP